jgi:hypothetical protein
VARASYIDPRVFEEGVLDLLANDRDSEAVEKADDLAGDLEAVAV